MVNIIGTEIVGTSQELEAIKTQQDAFLDLFAAARILSQSWDNPTARRMLVSAIAELEGK